MREPTCSTKTSPWNLPRLCFLFFIFIAVLGLEPRALYLLYHLSHSSQPLVCFGYFFRLGLDFLCGASLDQTPPTYASCTPGMIGMHHHTWLEFTQPLDPTSQCWKPGIEEPSPFMEWSQTNPGGTFPRAPGKTLQYSRLKETQHMQVSSDWTLAGIKEF
jgi:hypothetical protein